MPGWRLPDTAAPKHFNQATKLGVPKPRLGVPKPKLGVPKLGCLVEMLGSSGVRESPTGQPGMPDCSVARLLNNRSYIYIYIYIYGIFSFVALHKTTYPAASIYMGGPEGPSRARPMRAQGGPLGPGPRPLKGPGPRPFRARAL